MGGSGGEAGEAASASARHLELEARQVLQPKDDRLPTVSWCELWLHWLQRHSPAELELRALATLSLLRLDGRSERGFAELARLLPKLHGAPPLAGEAPSQALVTARGSESRAAADEAAAARALSLGTVLPLVAYRIEMAPRDEPAWRVFDLVLSWMLEDGVSAGATATSGSAAAHADVGRWWEDNVDWWPTTCFEAPLLRRGTGVDDERYEREVGSHELWALRQRCAEALLIMLQQLACGETAQWRLLLAETQAAGLNRVAAGPGSSFSFL